MRVRRDVVDAAVERVEVRRARSGLRDSPAASVRKQVVGAWFAGAEPLRRLLRDVERHDVRAVERQQVLAAQPVEVDVAHAVRRRG